MCVHMYLRICLTPHTLQECYQDKQQFVVSSAVYSLHGLTETNHTHISEKASTPHTVAKTSPIPRTDNQIIGLLSPYRASVNEWMLHS